jgi:hypothetical protein
MASQNRYTFQFCDIIDFLEVILPKIPLLGKAAKSKGLVSLGILDAEFVPDDRHAIL